MTEEEERKQNQEQWERFEHSWRLTYTTHRQADYSVGRQRGEDGNCHCPICQPIRQMDVKKKEGPADG